MLKKKLRNVNSKDTIQLNEKGFMIKKERNL